MSNRSFTRPHAAELLRRLQEPRRFLQIVTGARQVGKTTIVNQVAARSGRSYRYASADDPTLQGADTRPWFDTLTTNGIVGAGSWFDGLTTNGVE